MFLYESPQFFFSIREEERGIIYFREYRRVEDLVSREIDIVMEIGAGKEMDGVFPDGFNIVFKGKGIGKGLVGRMGYIPVPSSHEGVHHLSLFHYFSLAPLLQLHYDHIAFSLFVSA